MPFTNPDDQRKHVADGEGDVKKWKDEEQRALTDLNAKAHELSRNGTNPDLQKRVADAKKRYDNVKEARERRQDSVDAAKRAFGWIE